MYRRPSALRSLGEAAQGVANPLAQLFAQKASMQREDEQVAAAREFEKQQTDMAQQYRIDLANLNRDISFQVADYNDKLSDENIADADKRVFSQNTATNITNNLTAEKEKLLASIESLASMPEGANSAQLRQQAQDRITAIDDVLGANSYEELIAKSQNLTGSVTQAEVGGAAAQQARVQNVNAETYTFLLNQIGDPSKSDEARQESLTALQAMNPPQEFMASATALVSTTDPEARTRVLQDLEGQRLANEQTSAQTNVLEYQGERFALMTPIEMRQAMQSLSMGKLNKQLTEVELKARQVSLGYLDQQLGLGIAQLEQGLAQGDNVILMQGLEIQAAEVGQLVTAMETGAVPTNMSEEFKSALKKQLGVTSDAALETKLADVAGRTGRLVEAQITSAETAAEVASTYALPQAQMETELLRLQTVAGAYQLNRQQIVDGQADAWNSVQHMSTLQTAVDNGDVAVVAAYQAAIGDKGNPLHAQLQALNISDLSGFVTEANMNFQDEKKRMQLADDMAKQQLANSVQSYYLNDQAAHFQRVANGRDMGSLFMGDEDINSFLSTSEGQAYAKLVGPTGIASMRAAAFKNGLDEDKRLAAVSMELMLGNPPPTSDAAAWQDWNNQLETQFMNMGLSPLVARGIQPGIAYNVRMSEQVTDLELQTGYQNLANMQVDAAYKYALIAQTKAQTAQIGKSTSGSGDAFKGLDDLTKMVNERYDDNIKVAQEALSSCRSDSLGQDCSSKEVYLNDVIAQRDNELQDVNSLFNVNFGATPAQQGVAEREAAAAELAELANLFQVNSPGMSDAVAMSNAAEALANGENYQTVSQNFANLYLNDNETVAPWALFPNGGNVPEGSGVAGQFGTAFGNARENIGNIVDLFNPNRNK